LKVKTKITFSGVPKGTTGTAIKETDGSGLYKITWNQGRHREIDDWFNQGEFDLYLEKI